MSKVLIFLMICISVGLCNLHFSIFFLHFMQPEKISGTDLRHVQIMLIVCKYVFPRKYTLSFFLIAFVSCEQSRPKSQPFATCLLSNQSTVVIHNSPESKFSLIKKPIRHLKMKSVVKVCYCPSLLLPMVFNLSSATIEKTEWCLINNVVYECSLGNYQHMSE